MLIIIIIIIVIAYHYNNYLYIILSALLLQFTFWYFLSSLPPTKPAAKAEQCIRLCVYQLHTCFYNDVSTASAAEPSIGRVNTASAAASVAAKPQIKKLAVVADDSDDGDRLAPVLSFSHSLFDER